MELQAFRKNKNDSLTELNNVREDMGIPKNVDDLPYEVVQSEKQLKDLYDKLGEGNYEDFEKLKNDESLTDVALKNKDEQPNQVEGSLSKANSSENTEKKITEDGVEKTEKSPLGPGDEVFSKGNFYKIYDIHMPTDEEEKKRWDAGKEAREAEFNEISKLTPFTEGKGNDLKERKLFEEKKRAEFPKSERIITAIIKGGEEQIELNEANVIKIDTPEQREKIVKMQKDEDKAEARAAKSMGLGGTKKIVDNITGQPGKF